MRERRPAFIRTLTCALALNLTRELLDLGAASGEDAFDIRARALPLTDLMQEPKSAGPREITRGLGCKAHVPADEYTPAARDFNAPTSIRSFDS